MEAPFELRLFEVHPMNSQFVPLSMMRFEYKNKIKRDKSINIFLIPTCN